MGLVGRIHAIEGQVAIHGSNEGEGAGRTYQKVALGEHEEIFRRTTSQVVDMYLGTQLLIVLFRYLSVVRREIDMYVLVRMLLGKAVDVAGIDFVRVTVDAILPLCIVATTDVNAETDGRWMRVDGRWMMDDG